MSFLRALRVLVLGETWTVPAGVALTVTACALLEAVAGAWWTDLGGFVLLAGAIATVTWSVARAGPRRG
jgi:hypothetical protein